ncbi:putative trafficking protein particle complex subunit 2 [Quercus suber]|uniref:Trafficking protein particle complex subunit 2 n=1 Tax=Quercus suber TaxID=58331 RepID=A0AAW0KSY5_QUESU
MPDEYHLFSLLVSFTTGFFCFPLSASSTVTHLKLPYCFPAPGFNGNHSLNDIPIYEAEVGSATKREDAAQLHQFILHAALDIVQDLAWTTSAMFLKAIDRFNDLVVSVYVTAAYIHD